MINKCQVFCTWLYNIRDNKNKTYLKWINRKEQEQTCQYLETFVTYHSLFTLAISVSMDAFHGRVIA